MLFAMNPGGEIAEGSDAAGVALRASRCAAALAVGDEAGVPSRPDVFGQEAPQRHLGFERRLRLDEAEAVRDAVHVDVDADRGLFKRERHDEIGRLPPDAGQFAERLDQTSAYCKNHIEITRQKRCNPVIYGNKILSYYRLFNLFFVRGDCVS